MSPEATALQTALVLLHAPTQIRIVRVAPLPEASQFLLRIAVGDQDALAQAAKISDRNERQLQKAASFFIEQVLLAPDSDSYRVLGGRQQSTIAELRRNLALLLRLLHPDVGMNKEQSRFAARVTRAWEDIKTPERRLSYDSRPKQKSQRLSKSRLKAIISPQHPSDANEFDRRDVASLTRRVFAALLHPFSHRK